MEIKLLAVLLVSNIAIYIQIKGLNDKINNLGGHTNKTPLKPRKKPTEQTDEQRQHNTLMSNIDNYNGTGAKQEKVR